MRLQKGFLLAHSASPGSTKRLVLGFRRVGGFKGISEQSSDAKVGRASAVWPSSQIGVVSSTSVS